jgi:hypothetical protein
MPNQFEKGDRIAYAFEYAIGKGKELVMHGGTVEKFRPQLTKDHNRAQKGLKNPRLGKMYDIVFDPLPKHGWDEKTKMDGLLFFDSLYGAEGLNSWIYCSMNSDDKEAAAYFNEMCQTKPSMGVSIFNFIW